MSIAHWSGRLLVCGALALSVTSPAAAGRPRPVAAARRLLEERHVPKTKRADVEQASERALARWRPAAAAFQADDRTTILDDIAGVRAAFEKVPGRATLRSRALTRRTLAEIARVAAAETTRRMKLIDALIEIADPYTSPQMPWSLRKAEKPHLDWETWGLDGILEERRVASANLDGAHGNVVYMARVASDLAWLARASGVKIDVPTEEALVERLEVIESLGRRVKRYPRGVRSDQLSALMRHRQ